jgi:hypothetical protein
VSINGGLIVETHDSQFAEDAVLRRTEEVTKQIEEEQNLWELNQLHPGMFQVDMYQMLVKVRTLLRIMEERLEFTEAELTLLLREETLKQLQMDRKLATEARAAQLVIAQSQLLGPDGNPLTN